MEFLCIPLTHTGEEMVSGSFTWNAKSLVKVFVFCRLFLPGNVYVIYSTNGMTYCGYYFTLPAELAEPVSKMHYESMGFTEPYTILNKGD